MRLTLHRFRIVGGPHDALDHAQPHRAVDLLRSHSSRCRDLLR